MMEDVREIYLPADFFSGNRKRLLERLPCNTIVVVFAGAVVKMSVDNDYPFFANRNFYYLTGIEQEDSVLVLYKSAEGKAETRLFVQPYDAHRERWVGKRLTKEEASKLSGCEEILYLSELDTYITPFLADSSIHIALEEGLAYGPGKAFQKRVLSLGQEYDRIDLAKHFSVLRRVKQPIEIEMIKKSIALTDLAIREMAEAIRPGVTELELSARFNYALARRGCLIPAFPSIFAAGDNALCLHHMNPVGVLEKDRLIQIDVGGRVAGLCADISRVFPASGVFSDKQKKLYEAVRACQEIAFAALRPGINLVEVNQIVRQEAGKWLVELGLIADDEKKESRIDEYYWHNVSHHMGMDVHDIVGREVSLEAGMVVTVEPGIYVPEWGTGFRIEEDVLITSEGCLVLSADLPREMDDICRLMGS